MVARGSSVTAAPSHVRVALPWVLRPWVGRMCQTCSCWLGSEGVGKGDISEPVADQFMCVMAVPQNSAGARNAPATAERPAVGQHHGAVLLQRVLWYVLLPGWV